MVFDCGLIHYGFGLLYGFLNLAFCLFACVVSWVDGFGCFGRISVGCFFVGFWL